MMTKQNQYTCAQCGETFDKGWSDDEALAELGTTWAIPIEDCAIVCDDCYNMMMNPDKFRKNARKDLADMYRKLRKDNPAIARLTWRRMKGGRESAYR